MLLCHSLQFLACFHPRIFFLLLLSLTLTTQCCFLDTFFSLDVAAIEMDMGKPVQYDKEIVTIGLSNILSGCTGGFTGSYIFSQTIFTYRTHCNSRMVGMWVMIGELILFFVYVDPMMYIPLVSK